MFYFLFVEQGWSAFFDSVEKGRLGRTDVTRFPFAPGGATVPYRFPRRFVTFSVPLHFCGTRGAPSPPPPGRTARRARVGVCLRCALCKLVGRDHEFELSRCRSRRVRVRQEII